jgi:parvulin-like peptidyl-prolyl isomerase
MRFEQAAHAAALMLSFGLSFALSNTANSAEGVSTVVARQGSATVTLAEVDAFAQRIPPKDRPGFFDNPQRLEALISNLLMQKQLAAEARAAGLDRQPSTTAQIDIAVDEVLAKQRLTDMRENAKIPDMSELAQEQYIAHKEKYVTPGTLNVKHVLISDKSRSEEEAKAIAETVDKEAKAAPDKFDELVEKYSDDPGKSSNKGLITQAGSNRYDPAFSQAAEALKKPGDISPVVKTKFGFHVLELVSRTPDQQKKFADVRDQIVAQLRDEYVDKAVKEHTDALKNLPMDANQDLVASLRSRYGSLQAVPVSETPPTPSAGR